MKKTTFYSLFTKLNLILGFSFVALSGFAQEIITIQQAIDKTLSNNLQVKQSQFSESLSDINLKQSKLALYPSFNGNVGQNMSWGRTQVASGLFLNTQNYLLNTGVNTNVDLFNGFTKINQIKQNKVLLDAGKSNTEKGRWTDILMKKNGTWMLVGDHGGEIKNDD